MSGSFDIDDGNDAVVAGEYVLGTLGPDERLQALARIASDPDFARAVSWWEDRLAPLSVAAGSVAPPSVLWSRLESSLAGDMPGRAPADNVVPFPSRARPGAWNSVGFWRSLSVGAIAVAAGLAAFIVLRPMPPVPHVFVAGLAQPGVASAVFLAEVTPDGTVTIKPTGETKPPAGRDFELWTLAQGDTTPKSLGVLPAGGKRVALGKVPAPGVQLLVSVEPPGGSPTGLPTGPVVFAGALAAFD